MGVSKVFTNCEVANYLGFSTARVSQMLGQLMKTGCLKKTENIILLKSESKNANKLSWGDKMDVSEIMRGVFGNVRFYWRVMCFHMKN